ncbi:hypothetical protein PSCICL_13530 [Pseudomonas cichorii]|nr:hypothetical protein PSCICL_13530 [Pseudomonas cichorii]
MLVTDEDVFNARTAQAFAHLRNFMYAHSQYVYFWGIQGFIERFICTVLCRILRMMALLQGGMSFSQGVGCSE